MPAWWENPTATHAYILSCISVLLTIAAAIAGIVGYVKTDNSLLFSYGIENLVDFFSSAVVLWRFNAPSWISPEKVELLNQREKRASIAISFVLFILGMGIIIAAIADYKHGIDPNLHLPLLVTISFISMPIFGILTIVKLQFANKLRSRSLQKDGYCSLIGTTLSASLFFNTLIVAGSPSAWVLDPIISLLIGAVSFFIGVRSLLINVCEKGIPIWSLDWWMLSQGTGEEVVDSPDVGEEMGETKKIQSEII